MITAIQELKTGYEKHGPSGTFFSVTPADARAIKRAAKNWPPSQGRSEALRLRAGKNDLHDIDEAGRIVRAAEDYEIWKRVEANRERLMPLIVELVRAVEAAE